MEVKLILPDQFVEVKWNSKTKSHYEKLGYFYTKMGDSFLVPPDDLTKGSCVKVKVICDECHYEFHSIYGKHNNCSEQIETFIELKRYAELERTESQEPQDKKLAG